MILLLVHCTRSKEAINPWVKPLQKWLRLKLTFIFFTTQSINSSCTFTMTSSLNWFDFCSSEFISKVYKIYFSDQSDLFLRSIRSISKFYKIYFSDLLPLRCAAIVWRLLDKALPNMPGLVGCFGFLCIFVFMSFVFVFLYILYLCFM